MLSGFMAKVEDGNNKLSVATWMTTLNGYLVTYYYNSGVGTRLTSATSILLIYNYMSALMSIPNYFAYSNSSIYSYTQAISLI